MTEAVVSNISRKWVLSPLVVMYVFPTAGAAIQYVPRAFERPVILELVLITLACAALISAFVEVFALIVGWTALVLRPGERNRNNFMLVGFGTLAFLLYVASMAYALSRPVY